MYKRDIRAFSHFFSSRSLCTRRYATQSRRTRLTLDSLVTLIYKVAVGNRSGTLCPSAEERRGQLTRLNEGTFVLLKYVFTWSKALSFLFSFLFLFSFSFSFYSLLFSSYSFSLSLFFYFLQLFSFITSCHRPVSIFSPDSSRGSLTRIADITFFLRARAEIYSRCWTARQNLEFYTR